MTKKLEKRPIEASNKCLDAEDFDDESNEKSDNEHKSKNDYFLGSMSIEQIQSLIANAVEAQLGEESCKTHLYTKRIDALRMPRN